MERGQQGSFVSSRHALKAARLLAHVMAAPQLPRSLLLHLLEMIPDMVAGVQVRCACVCAKYACCSGLLVWGCDGVVGCRAGGAALARAFFRASCIKAAYLDLSFLSGWIFSAEVQGPRGGGGAAAGAGCIWAARQS